MPPIIEVTVLIFTMLGGFFAVFVLIYLLALFLSPIERSLSKLIWSMNTPPPAPQTPPKGSFKDFSKKHISR